MLRWTGRCGQRARQNVYLINIRLRGQIAGCSERYNYDAKEARKHSGATVRK
jgi:hypothetical protein